MARILIGAVLVVGGLGSVGAGGFAILWTGAIIVGVILIAHGVLKLPEEIQERW